MHSIAQRDYRFSELQSIFDSFLLSNLISLCAFEPAAMLGYSSRLSRRTFSHFFNFSLSFQGPYQLARGHREAQSPNLSLQDPNPGPTLLN